MTIKDESTNFQVGRDRLSIQDVVHIARYFHTANDLTTDVENRMQASAEWVHQLVHQLDDKTENQARPFYGINTGFGAQAGKSTLRSEYLSKVLSRNLIASHAVGVGNYFDEEIVRAAMVVRMNTLAQGFSGVRPLIVKKLTAMLNQRVYAAVPSQGSLGSGDLAPLSHLALVLSKPPTPESEDTELQLDANSGEAFVLPGEAFSEHNEMRYHLTEDRVTGEQAIWQQVDGRTAMSAVGGQIELSSKEGLALVSGSTFSAAIAALAVHDAKQLLECAKLVSGMTLEAIKGFRDPFLPEVQAIYGHPGSIAAAKTIMQYTQGSTLLDGNRDVDPQRVPPQDPVSIRAAAQVLGAAQDALDFIRKTVNTELNAVTDNPLIFLDLPREYKTISCGNFQSTALAMSMDYLGTILTVIGDMAERHIFKLTDYTFYQAEEQAKYGLEPFLVREPLATTGLNNGLMIPQYTAAALVAECKNLAHPDSVNSTPSSANKEDHVSMSFNAARHARDIVSNIEIVVAIELLCAAQALSLRQNRAQDTGEVIKLGLATAAILNRVREEIPFMNVDRVLYPDVRAAITLVRSGELITLARQQIAGVEREAND